MAKRISLAEVENLMKQKGENSDSLAEKIYRDYDSSLISKKELASRISKLTFDKVVDFNLTYHIVVKELGYPLERILR